MRNKANINFTCKYVDDHLIVSPPRGTPPLDQSPEEVSWRFDKLCETLGIVQKEEKRLGPDTTMLYLGIELDTIDMVARLSSEKLADLLSEVDRILGLENISLRGVQRFLGLLNWVCMVVFAGRAFLSRIIELVRVAKSNSISTLRILPETRQVLLWWKRFLPSYNGVSFFLEYEWTHAVDFGVETDACNFGAGGFWGPHYFFERFDENTKSCSIAVRELIAVFLACKAWASQWKRKKILFRSDNTAVEAAVNKRRVKDRTLMAWIRELHLLEALYSFQIRVRYLPGKQNVLADHLSRSRLGSFRTAFRERFQSDPDAFPTSVRIPDLSTRI